LGYSIKSPRKRSGT